MSATTAFRTHLRELSTEALTKTPDPKEAARLVFERLTPSDCIEAAALLLPEYVAEVARSQRPRVNIRRAEESPAPAPKARPRAAGHRARMVRESWLSKTLSASYALTSGEWKRLRDMTSADLIDAATQRYMQAERNSSIGDQLTALAKAVTDAGAEHVGDLAEEMLEAILRPAEDAA